jgi:hypothetical protein
MAKAWTAPDWPRAIATGWLVNTPELNLSRLDALEKKLVWGCLQRSRPRLAALLKDPVLHSLCTTFGAEIILEVDDLRGMEHVDVDAAGG